MATICPVCNGKQKVPGGFYDINNTGYTELPQEEACRSCYGKGFIEAFDKEKIEDMYYNALNEQTIKKLENRA